MMLLICTKGVMSLLTWSVRRLSWHLFLNMPNRIDYCVIVHCILASLKMGNGRGHEMHSLDQYNPVCSSSVLETPRQSNDPGFNSWLFG